MVLRVFQTKVLILNSSNDLPKNEIKRFFIYHFIKFYEGKYYLEFRKSDLEGLLRKKGIEIKAELPALLGAAKILKGIKMK